MKVTGETTLKDLLDLADLQWTRKGYITSPQTLVLGAMEELGELSQAILLEHTDDFFPSPKKLGPEYDGARDVAHEVGDVITYLLHLCNSLGIVPAFHFLDGAEEK